MMGSTIEVSSTRSGAEDVLTTSGQRQGGGGEPGGNQALCLQVSTEVTEEVAHGGWWVIATVRHRFYW